MTRRILFLLLAVVSVGCGNSFVTDTIDGGPDADADADGGSRDLGADAGTPDFGIRDLGTYDGPEDCSEYGGHRRCDERCPRPCASSSFCLEWIGLCIPELFDTCAFTALSAAPPRDDIYCMRGGPCLVEEGDGSAESKWQGFCLGADVCLAAEGQGLPPFTCRYADGSVVVTGPPATPCPPSSAGAPFCGGSCGMSPAGCPNTTGPVRANTQLSCIGLSDARAYGVCVYDESDCDAIPIGSDLTFFHDACLANYGAPCACMQLAAGADGPLSYFVKADACIRYRAEYPGSVECLDATRTPLP